MAPRTASADADTRLRLSDGTDVCLRAIDLDPAIALDARAVIMAGDAYGRTVGRVSYARVYGPRGELAFEVDDALWHLGLPEALLLATCARAAEAGISTFLARVPASDLRLLALLRERFAARETRDGAHVEVQIATAAVPPSGLAAGGRCIGRGDRPQAGHGMDTHRQPTSRTMSRRWHVPT